MNKLTSKHRHGCVQCEPGRSELMQDTGEEEDIVAEVRMLINIAIPEDETFA